MTRDPDTDGDSIVRAADLAVSLGETAVLEGVDLSAATGEFVGLVGPNGAGKTTLLRTLGGGLAPDRGTVTVDGRAVHDLASRESSRLVATVPQDTSLSFDFSVRETVEMGRTPYVSRFGRQTSDDREAVDRAMARTEVERFADRSVTAVSGGERSRVLLARALAQDTPVLLLDEPTASLDVNHQIRTLDLVADLVDEGKTVVAAIHDLNLAARYCDSLALVADAGLVARGPPEEVLTRDRLRETFDANAVVSEDPVTGAPHVTTLSDDRPDPDHAPGDGPPRAHVVAGGGRAGPLLSRLATAGVALSVGAVPEGDRDAAVAEAFGAETVTVPPFAGVDGAARERVADLAADADAAVVADVDLVAGVRGNLTALREAGVPVICVEARPLAERAADEAATEAYRDLREDGVAVDPDGVLAGLADCFDRPAPAADESSVGERLAADD